MSETISGDDRIYPREGGEYMDICGRCGATKILQICTSWSYDPGFSGYAFACGNCDAWYEDGVLQSHKKASEQTDFDRGYNRRRKVKDLFAETEREGYWL